MELDQSEHTISANNILFGRTQFLTLALPSEWRVSKSYLSPDVHSNVRRGVDAWVEAGQTDQIVYHPAKRIALDLTILVKRGKRDELKANGVEVHSEGLVQVNGHEALYCLGQVRVGFLKRKLAKLLFLFFHCEELNRTVTLRFTGTCHETDLLEILGSLAGAKCH
jgi:hypothetical protein